MLHPYLAAGCLAAALLSTPAAAAMAPPSRIAASDLRLAGADCGYGYHRDVTGFCVDSMDYSRRCPPGLFAIPFPNGNGYRCVPTEWLRSSGWLENLLGLRD